MDVEVIEVGVVEVDVPELVVDAEGVELDADVEGLNLDVDVEVLELDVNVEILGQDADVEVLELDDVQVLKSRKKVKVVEVGVFVLDVIEVMWTVRF